MPEYIVVATNLGALDEFTRGYLECAEWCGVDAANECGGWCHNCDNPDESKRCRESDRTKLDRADNPHWSTDALSRAIMDCQAFQESNTADLADADPAQAGHDFWLTRNHHGAGFWDGDYPKEIGKRLTDAAHVYGEVNVWYNEETEELSLS